SGADRLSLHSVGGARVCDPSRRCRTSSDRRGALARSIALSRASWIPLNSVFASSSRSLLSLRFFLERTSRSPPTGRGGRIYVRAVLMSRRWADGSGTSAAWHAGSALLLHPRTGLERGRVSPAGARDDALRTRSRAAWNHVARADLSADSSC